MAKSTIYKLTSPPLNVCVCMVYGGGGGMKPNIWGLKAIWTLDMFLSEFSKSNKIMSTTQFIYLGGNCKMSSKCNSYLCLRRDGPLPKSWPQKEHFIIFLFLTCLWRLSIRLNFSQQWSQARPMWSLRWACICFPVQKLISQSLHWYFEDPFSAFDELWCLSKLDFLLNCVLHFSQL